MRRSAVFRVSFILFLLLALTASISLAQESDSDSEPKASASALRTIHAVSGNAFTYQGQLLHGGESVDGLCAFEFSLWDDADIGNQVGASVIKEDVQVIEGLFTVQLDFGLSAFKGAALWLGIEVDCGGGLIVLTPRQPITAVPYALYAKKVTDGPGSGLNADLLDGQQATAFAESNHDHDGDYWLLGGNAGTTPGTHFLGTTDQQALEFHVNGARVLRIEPSNNAPNFIGGVSINQVVQGVYGATIAGGGNVANQNFNYVTDNLGTVSGGSSNTAGNDGVVTDDAEGATVGGGAVNWAEHKYATVGGGYGGQAMGEYSTIAGGYSNTAAGSEAAIGGGYGNITTGDESTIGGGFENRAYGDYAIVGGGEWNEATEAYASVGGGGHNLAGAKYATIAGGGPAYPGMFSTSNNRVTDDYGTIGGGGGNWAGNDDEDPENSQFATVAGGMENKATGLYATVGGGKNNKATAAYATVAGGGPSDINNILTNNVVTDNYGTIGGGGKNRAGSDDEDPENDQFATVSGGLGNKAEGSYSTIAGGMNNLASQLDTTVGGGEKNEATNQHATIAGGFTNKASGTGATAGGGVYNEAIGSFSVIPGGHSNSASEWYSFAAGRNAKAFHEGAFVWADSQAEDFASNRDNQFKVRASGGVTFETDNAPFQVSSDSVLYLSPHSMVIRGDPTGLTLLPLDNGGMRITNDSAGANITRYFSIPVSTFGTLFGAPVYVKELKVCYQTSSAYFDVTAVLKNTGGMGATYYLLSDANYANPAYKCFILNTNVPKMIDNSSWVQFNIHFYANGGVATIHNVRLTLTELPS